MVPWGTVQNFLLAIVVEAYMAVAEENKVILCGQHKKTLERLLHKLPPPPF
jgi:hypothetical protein